MADNEQFFTALSEKLCDIVGWEYPSHGQRRILAVLHGYLDMILAELDQLREDKHVDVDPTECISSMPDNFANDTYRVLQHLAETDVPLRVHWDRLYQRWEAVTQDGTDFKRQIKAKAPCPFNVIAELAALLTAHREFK